MQERSKNTRRQIITAAINLFDEVGYADTTLQHVLERAGITKGAFYYHFESKEAVATAIIEESECVFRDTVLRILTDESSSSLDKVITLSFVIPQTHVQSTPHRVANELRQSLQQVSGAGPTIYQHRQESTLPLFTEALTRAVAEGDLREDIAVDKLAWTLWTCSVGNRVLCGATGADIIATTADMWQILLPAIVTAERLGDFRERLERLGAQDPVGALTTPASAPQ